MNIQSHFEEGGEKELLEIKSCPHGQSYIVRFGY